MDTKTRLKLKQIEEKIIEASLDNSLENKNNLQLPNKFEVNEIVKEIEKMMFPDFFGHDWSLLDIYQKLHRQISLAWCYDQNCNCGKICSANDQKIDELTMSFIQQIPDIQKLLWKDLESFYLGDPAAKSKEEVVISYPGYYAIFVHRLAHALYEMGVPMLPRIMSESVHSKTGIDINPGAQIGEYFFMDHGTGVVIGETAIIGNHVKIYQGVTLGALSLQKGQALANVKRHPTIEDDVTIYSGASILGGKTVIGKGSVIGGNVFITESVPENSRVTHQSFDIIHE